VSEEKPWKHPKYDVMNMADDDIVLASIAKLYKSEMLLAVVEVERLKAEVERLTAELNKMTKTPDGVDGVEVKVSFWTKSGTRLPSSYNTFFWVNDKGGKS
jgi:uncharacterized small protein (DUF1192 family)